MIYKNKKQKRIKFKPKQVLYLFIILLIGISTFLLTYSYLESKKEGITFSQNVERKVVKGISTVNDIWEPQIPKYDDRYVTALILGIDARDPEIKDGIFLDNGKEDINTDTIIQVIYDTENNNIFMISIPRDLGIEYEDECLLSMNDYHQRKSVNHIYKLGNMADCPGGGIEMIKKYVEKITGFPVHYYAIVSLDSFIELVDNFGETDTNGKYGLWIDIPRTISSLYPNQDTGAYEYVYFQKGHRFLTSYELLQYARVRINSNDFDRTKRQQIVLKALKDKIFQLDTLTDPSAILQVVNSFDNNVIHSNIGIEEIRAGLEYASKVKESRTYTLTLDNKLNGLNKLLTIPAYSGGLHHESDYYLIPTVWNDADYSEDKFIEVKNYIKFVIENPDLYKQIE